MTSQVLKELAETKAQLEQAIASRDAFALRLSRHEPECVVVPSTTAGRYLCACCGHALAGGPAPYVNEVNELVFAGTRMQLSRQQAKVMDAICRCFPRTATYEYIATCVWSETDEPLDSQKQLQVWMHRIRRAIKRDKLPITVMSIWGVGVRLLRTWGEAQDGRPKIRSSAAYERSTELRPPEKRRGNS